MFTWASGEGVMADARNISCATVDRAGNIYAICTMDAGSVLKKMDPDRQAARPDQTWHVCCQAYRRVGGRQTLPAKLGRRTVSIYAPSPLSGRWNPGQATTKTIMEVSGK